MRVIWRCFFDVSSTAEFSFLFNSQGVYAFAVVSEGITGKIGVTQPSLEEKPAAGHLPAKRVRQKVRESGLKGVADILPVKVKPLADFIQVIAAELFKQGIGDDRCHNSFSDHTGSGNGAGVASFKS